LEGDLKSKVMAWLVDEGLEVRGMEVPAKAPVEWSLAATVRVPLQVNLVVQKPSQADKLVVTMGVKLSPQHQASFNSLPEPERADLRASLVEAMFHLCPHCIVIPQPPAPAALEGLAVSWEVPLHSYHGGLEGPVRLELARAVRVLANAYQLLVERLNARLGAPRGGPGQVDTMHM